MLHQKTRSGTQRLTLTANNTMKQQLQEALDYDPIHHAEQILGTEYRKSDKATMLGLFLMHQQRGEKDGLLLLNNDTNSWSQTFKEWEAVILDMGFSKVYEAPIADTGDFHRIYWHDDGILLNVDSYSEDTTANSATAYFFFKGPYGAMHRCSHGWSHEEDGISVFDASRDARDGFRFAIDQMREAGSFVSPWPEFPFLWLLNYMDTKTDDYDYKSITAERIKQLPINIQKAIEP